MRLTRSVLPAALTLGVLTVSLVLAACGGDEATTTTRAVTTTQATSATTEAVATTAQAVTTTQEVTTTALSAGVPPGQFWASMVYDPVGAQLVLFAGYTGGDQGLDDSLIGKAWAYDPVANTWAELHPTGDVPRGVGSMVYDPASGKVVLFGEFNNRKGVLANDTLAYDLSADTWTNLKPSPPVPPERWSPSMTYDPSTRKMVLFGGTAGAEFDDTWAYDPAANAWTELHPSADAPKTGDGIMGAYDPVSGCVIFYGGAGGNESYASRDTWAYDPVAGTWTELRPAGELPPATYNLSLVYDPSTRKMILFGGSGLAAEFGNDTWAYDPSANTWTNLRPSPPVPSPRFGYSMAYDPSTKKLILFGGCIKTVGWYCADDTWAYDPVANSWTELHPTESAP